MRSLWSLERIMTVIKQLKCFVVLFFSTSVASDNAHLEITRSLLFALRITPCVLWTPEPHPPSFRPHEAQGSQPLLDWKIHCPLQYTEHAGFCLDNSDPHLLSSETLSHPAHSILDVAFLLAQCKFLTHASR